MLNPTSVPLLLLRIHLLSVSSWNSPIWDVASGLISI